MREEGEGPWRPDDVVITAYIGPYGKAQSAASTLVAGERDVEDKWAECATKADHRPGACSDLARGQVAKLSIGYRGK